MSAEVRWLECIADGVELLVPEAHVDQVVELQVSPVPLAESWLRGAGIHQGRLVVLVRTGSSADAEPSADAVRRVAKAVLLALPDVRVGVAVEVDVVTTIRSAARAETDVVDGWCRKGRSDTGAEVRWLDVERLAARLADAHWGGGAS